MADNEIIAEDYIEEEVLGDVWTCPKCKIENDIESDRCQSCNRLRP